MYMLQPFFRFEMACVRFFLGMGNSLKIAIASLWRVLKLCGEAKCEGWCISTTPIWGRRQRIGVVESLDRRPGCVTLRSGAQLIHIIFLSRRKGSKRQASVVVYPGRRHARCVNSGSVRKSCGKAGRETLCVNRDPTRVVFHRCFPGFSIRIFHGFRVFHRPAWCRPVGLAPRFDMRSSCVKNLPEGTQQVSSVILPERST